MLGEVQYEHCKQRVPKQLHYQQDVYRWVKDTAVTTGRPRFVNIVERFYLQEGSALPAGLILNEITGELAGIPREIAENTTITIYGENQRGATKTTLSIFIRVGRCQSEGIFPSIEVGRTVVMDCRDQGGYVGTERRECVLGEVDGVWRRPSGYCLSYGLVAVSVVVIVLMVVIICLQIWLLIKRGKGKGKGMELEKGRKVVAGTTTVVKGKETV